MKEGELLGSDCLGFPEVFADGLGVRLDAV